MLHLRGSRFTGFSPSSLLSPPGGFLLLGPYTPPSTTQPIGSCHTQFSPLPTPPHHTPPPRPTLIPRCTPRAGSSSLSLAFLSSFRWNVPFWAMPFPTSVVNVDHSASTCSNCLFLGLLTPIPRLESKFPEGRGLVSVVHLILRQAPGTWQFLNKYLCDPKSCFPKSSLCSKDPY